MLRSHLSLAAAMAGLSAQAAIAQPAANPPQDQAADVAYLNAMFAHQACLFAHAKAADDHVSAPAAIAAKFKDACRAEEDRFIAGMKGYVARHPGMETPPDHFSEHDRLGAAESFVLEARKSNSAAAGDGPH